MVKKALIIALTSILLICIVFNVFNYFSTADSLSNFEINFEDIQFENELIHYKYLTKFNKTKINKIVFNSNYYDEFINRIKASNINYSTCAFDSIKEPKIKKYVEYNDNFICYEGSRVVQNSIKFTSEDLLIIIQKDDDITTVYFCDWV